MSTGEADRPLRELLQRFAASMCVGALFHAQQVRMFSDPENRYISQWSAADGWALILSMLIYGTLLFVPAIVLVLRRQTRLLFAFDHVFLFAAITAVVSNIAVMKSVSSLTYGILWLASLLLLIVVIAASLWSGSRRLTGFCRSLCVVFSPLVILFALTIGSWPNWSEPKADTIPIPTSKRSAAPIFIFVFDEWSYPRSTTNGEFVPQLKNLRQISEKSVFFQNARSAADSTKQSMPRLLYQTDSALEVRDGETFWSQGGRRIRSSDAASLFSRGRDAGYHSSMIGFYLPYRRILGNQVDYCHSFSQQGRPQSLWHKMRFITLDNMGLWHNLLTQQISMKHRRAVFCRWWYDMNQSMLRDTFDVIDRWPSNSLCVFHWPVPHAPFVINPDGSYRGPIDGTSDDYLTSLRALDHFVGRIVDRLQAAGKFEESLLVFTSDHSWRFDPSSANTTGPEWKRRVPLLIKLPGQTRAVVSDERIVTTQLTPILNAVMQGDDDFDSILKLITDRTPEQSIAPRQVDVD